MTYKLNNKIYVKEIKTADDVIEFAERAERAHSRYLNYIKNHSTMSATARSYRSNWKHFNNEYYDAHHEWLNDEDYMEYPEEFIENYYSCAYMD